MAKRKHPAFGTPCHVLAFAAKKKEEPNDARYDLQVTVKRIPNPRPEKVFYVTGMGILSESLWVWDNEHAGPVAPPTIKQVYIVARDIRRRYRVLPEDLLPLDAKEALGKVESNA